MRLKKIMKAYYSERIHSERIHIEKVPDNGFIEIFDNKDQVHLKNLLYGSAVAALFLMLIISSVLNSDNQNAALTRFCERYELHNSIHEGINSFYKKFKYSYKQIKGGV